LQTPYYSVLTVIQLIYDNEEKEGICRYSISVIGLRYECGYLCST